MRIESILSGVEDRRDVRIGFVVEGGRDVKWSVGLGCDFEAASESSS